MTHAADSRAIHTLTESLARDDYCVAGNPLDPLARAERVLICVTLPLSVLFAFLLMWVLRHMGIVDIQANIMSLAGITIRSASRRSGHRHDENASTISRRTSATEGDRDISELVIEPAARWRPSSSRMIMLLSFIPYSPLRTRGQSFTAGLHEELRDHRRRAHLDHGVPALILHSSKAFAKRGENQSSAASSISTTLLTWRSPAESGDVDVCGAPGDGSRMFPCRRSSDKGSETA